MKRTVLALGLVLSLALAAPAVAGAAKYKGKTDRNSAVNFKVSGGKVKGFAATVYVICGDGNNRFDAVIPPKAMKVKKGGKFSYKGRDKADGSNIEIKGKLKGKGRKKASGTVNLTDTSYSVFEQMFYGCTSGTPKWSAKKKK